MIWRVALGVWKFVVGDDWRVARGVILMLGAIAALAALGLPAWWLGPPVTLAILAGSIRRANQARRGPGPLA